MRFIHAADIHLDSPLAGMTQRRPELASLVASCTRDAFRALVDQAIKQEVDFLLIAGDLYDAEHRNYETGLFFAREMQRLGRPCILIHGNHDSVSQVTRSLRPPPNVTVLPSRKPGSMTLPHLNTVVHGQSFHSRVEGEDLAANYPKHVPGAFNIGLLHSSVEDPGDHARYAPCRLETLTARSYDYWALGHIHTRGILHEAPWVHFPGNTQGRHVRETGPRGATLVEVGEDGRIRSLDFLHTDVLRWAVVRVDTTGLDSMDALLSLVRSELNTAAEGGEGRPVIVRVLLEGATTLHPVLVANPMDLDRQVEGVAASVSSELHLERVRLRTTPAAGSSGDLLALEHAVRGALADPALITGLLRDFERLRTILPAGSEAHVPITEAELADLQDDAWDIVRHTLTGQAG